VLVHRRFQQTRRTVRLHCQVSARGWSTETL